MENNQYETLTFISLCLPRRIRGSPPPPLYESAKEITAILNDSQLGEKLGSGEMILLIEKSPNDKSYLIWTNHHRLQVNVSYEALEHPGPAHFKLHFETPTPLKQLKP